MIRPLSRREHELVVVALDRYADIERSAGNTITAGLLDELRREVESKPIRSQSSRFEDVA